MHLPIRVVGRSQPVEVPFQLQPSFKFAVHIPGHGVQEFVADLSSRDALKAHVHGIEHKGRLLNALRDDAAANYFRARETAQAILSAVLTRLGLDEYRRPVNLRKLSFMAIGVAHMHEQETRMACQTALMGLTPVWRDRTEPAPKVHVAADILDSYYQQVQDEVLGEWEDKAQREADDYLTGRASGSHSEVQP